MFGHDGIPVMVLKNCESEFSYTSDNLFSICLKESCFPDCWNILSPIILSKKIWERSTTKNYCLVSLVFVVSKISEKLGNNKLVDKSYS